MGIAVDRFFKLTSSFDLFFKRAFFLDEVLTKDKRKEVVVCCSPQIFESKFFQN